MPKKIKELENLLNWKNEKKVFAEISFAVFDDIVKRRGKRIADLLGFVFEMTEPVRNYIDKKSLVFAEQVNETTRKKIKETLKEGVSQGEGIGDLTKRVNEIFDNREKWEAERIARTEVLDASSWTDIEAYKQSGVVEKKEWLIAPSACDICAPLDGEKVDLDEDFGGEFDRPPAHPNCRCTTLPWFEGIERSAKEKPVDIEETIEKKVSELETKINEKVDKRVGEEMEKIEKSINEVLE